MCPKHSIICVALKSLWHRKLFLHSKAKMHFPLKLASREKFIRRRGDLRPNKTPDCGQTRILRPLRGFANRGRKIGIFKIGRWMLWSEGGWGRRVKARQCWGVGGKMQRVALKISRFTFKLSKHQFTFDRRASLRPSIF